MADSTDFEKMERDGWADPALAKAYADGFSQATRTVADGLAGAVGAGPGSEVLDLCTGHGVVAGALVARGASVTGVDFSDAMIALAREATPGARFVQGDAMAMTFADDRFDAVTIGFGVPHFPDVARGLAEATRVLKPGGRMAFSIWRGPGSRGAFGWLFQAVGAFGDPAVTLPPGPDAHAMADRAVAEPMMRAVGLDRVETTDVATQLWLDSENGLFDVFAYGAVRTASLLRGQDQPRLDAIRDALAAQVRKHGVAHEGGILVPAPSVIVSARREAAP